MILGKNNLQIIDMVKSDIPALNNLFIDIDGSTCAVNNKSLIVVEPVKKEVKEIIPLKENDKDEERERLVIASDSIKEVIKNISKDTTFKGLLEYVNAEVYKDSGGGENINFTLTDGKRRKQISTRKGNNDFVKYKDTLRSAFRRRNGVRLVLNRKVLMKMLSVIDKVCPDGSGYSPVYIEFTEDNDLIVRSERLSTGQRVIGLIASVEQESGGWLKFNRWERMLLKIKKRRKKNG